MGGGIIDSKLLIFYTRYVDVDDVLIIYDSTLTSPSLSVQLLEKNSYLC